VAAVAGHGRRHSGAWQFIAEMSSLLCIYQSSDSAIIQVQFGMMLGAFQSST
jgi:hypothetical protein